MRKDSSLSIFEPISCTPENKLALIIPYRNREEHLKLFLYYTLPTLIAQKSRFSVFLVEQKDAGLFNVGKLLNAGFIEARKISDFDCYIFHDIDLIKMNKHFPYKCDDKDIYHLSDNYNTNRFSPFTWRQRNYFDGVVALTEDMMTRSNGFSNYFYGIHGVYKEFDKRVAYRGYAIVKPKPSKLNLWWELEHKDVLKMDLRAKSFHSKVTKKVSEYGESLPGDGLKNINYRLAKTYVEPYGLFTKFSIDLRSPADFEEADFIIQDQKIL